MAKKSATTAPASDAPQPRTDLAITAPNLGSLISVAAGSLGLDITRDEIARSYTSRTVRGLNHAAEDALDEAKALAQRTTALEKDLTADVLTYAHPELLARAQAVADACALAEATACEDGSAAPYVAETPVPVLEAALGQVMITASVHKGAHVTYRSHVISFQAKIPITASTRSLLDQIEETKKQHTAKLREAQALKHRASQKEVIYDEAYEALTRVACGQKDETQALNRFLDESSASLVETAIAAARRSSS